MRPWEKKKKDPVYCREGFPSDGRVGVKKGTPWAATERGKRVVENGASVEKVGNRKLKRKAKACTQKTDVLSPRGKKRWNTIPKVKIGG